MTIPNNALCTIILPTLATEDRAHQLRRAIQSIFDGTTSSIEVLICVNGKRWHSGTIEALREIPGVSIHLLDVASLPKAIAFGRSQVSSRYFGFLDDDDYLLPKSLDWKIDYLEQNPSVDLIVADGFRKDVDGERIALENMHNVSKDPFCALFEENWLPSCGGLFRTSSIDQNYFNNYHSYAEWTWLAFQLMISGKRVAAIDRPSFVINDTPGSLSKSKGYHAAYLQLYRRMLAEKPTERVKRIIEYRIASQLHDLSDRALGEGKLIESFQMHVRSLLQRGGLSYVSYTRHILKAVITQSMKK